MQSNTACACAYVACNLLTARMRVLQVWHAVSKGYDDWNLPSKNEEVEVCYWEVCEAWKVRRVRLLVACSAAHLLPIRSNITSAPVAEIWPWRESRRVHRLQQAFRFDATLGQREHT